MPRQEDPESAFAWDDRFVAALGVTRAGTDESMLRWLEQRELGLALEDPSCRALFLEILRTAQDVLVTYGPTVDCTPTAHFPRV